MKWEVQLVGDDSDLSQLALSFTGGEGFEITKTDQGYVLRANEFEKIGESRELRKKALEIVESISGIARLLLRSQRKLEVGAILEHRNDGTRNIIISPEPATIHLRGGLVSLIVKRADGTVEKHYPAELGPNLVETATRVPEVSRALRLRNAGNLNWVDLYRLWEVIEADVPLNSMVNQSWTTKKIVERFKRTANSQKAVGDLARHGTDPHVPPKSPLKLEEARSFIDELLKQWISSKTPKVL